MKSNAEFRELAWKRLWADHWFGLYIGVGQGFFYEELKKINAAISTLDGNTISFASA